MWQQNIIKAKGIFTKNYAVFGQYKKNPWEKKKKKVIAE